VASWQGYIEGEYTNVASSIGGRLQSLQVRRGQNVAAGAALFSLESREETDARQQADEQLKSAQARLADLKLGNRQPEVGVIRAQQAQAQAARQQADDQLMRDQAQFEAGGIARSQLDDARANQAIKAARLRELTAQLQVAQLPAREDQIRAQTAQVAAARAMANAASWRLDQKRLTATEAAQVTDTLYRIGEWVPAGSPVLRLLAPRNVKVRFVVPEPVVGNFTPGRMLALHCDGCGGALAASVNWVSSEPEYTPPVIYSNDSRARMVFMVEALPAPEIAARLRPGQPVQVTLQ
jgi:HlyD family secretion protein